MRRQSAIVAGAALLLVGTAACGSTPSGTPAQTVTVTQTPPAATETVTAMPESAPEQTQEPVEATTAIEPPPPPTSADRAMTLAQEQAVEEAQSYLDYSGFSEQGLLEQLTSQYGAGFEKADAQFAIDYLKPDWNAEAAESAASYLESGSFSRSGLLEQLTSEYGAGFTRSQALYGLKAVGY